jgi:hypothetical protein
MANVSVATNNETEKKLCSLKTKFPREHYVAHFEGSVAGSDVSLFSSYFKGKCYGEAEILLTIRGKCREDFYFAVKPRFIRKECQLRIDLTFDDRL